MNIALIGFGYWGPNIAKNLMKSKKADLYAICDLSEANLARARLLYGDATRYVTDYKALLKDPRVDGVALALRYDVSFPIAKEVLESGKHLFIEKPMALTVEDVETLGSMSRERGLVLHTDHIMVFHPIIRYIKSMIDGGELGEILYFDSSRLNLGPHIKNDINVMWDLAVHDLAVLDYFCGGKVPTHVGAMGISHYSGQKEELTYLSVEYPSFVAFLKSSWISPLKERMMVVGGTKKMVVFDDMKLDEKLMIYDKGVDLRDDFSVYGNYELRVRMGDMTAPYIPTEDSLLNSLEHFVDCVQQHKESISGYRQAARVISILEQADAQLSRKKGGIK